MIHLAAFADATLLHLDEVADPRLRVQHGVRPQARERSDVAAATDVRALEHAVGVDLRVGAELAVAHAHVRPDAHTVAEDDLALEHRVDVDVHVAPAVQVAAHVDARRIGQRDAVAHQQLGLWRRYSASAAASWRLSLTP